MLCSQNAILAKCKQLEKMSYHMMWSTDVYIGIQWNLVSLQSRTITAQNITMSQGQSDLDLCKFMDISYHDWAP